MCVCVFIINQQRKMVISDENASSNNSLKPASFQGKKLWGSIKILNFNVDGLKILNFFFNFLLFFLDCVGGARKVGQNRRALGVINQSLVEGRPYPCVVNKRALSG